MSGIKRLTAREVANAKPDKGRRAAMLPDGGNLYLQATFGKSGDVRRSWVFRYELDGRRHDLGLGGLNTFNLVEARERARDLRQQLADGIDPFTAKRQAKKDRLTARAAEAKAVTFKQCAADYLTAHAAGWRNAKHAKQWSSTLETYAYPVLGNLAVSDIEVAHVLRVLEPIWRTVPETASRVRGRIEAVLGYATVRGYRSGDNPARWRGHLATLLPAKGKLRTVKHHRALPYIEMPAFISALRQRSGDAARALEFLALTACRPGEVVGAKWSEIDPKAKVWTIPASRMKSHREHRVPLSPAALAILAGMKHRGDGKVFACGKTSLLEMMRAVQADGVPHGLRASFRTWASEQTSFAHEVVEQALAHVVSNAVVRAYKRTDLFDRRRQLMQQWATWCSRPVPTGATVTALAR
jgi:integrase